MNKAAFEKLAVVAWKKRILDGVLGRKTIRRMFSGAEVGDKSLEDLIVRNFSKTRTPDIMTGRNVSFLMGKKDIALAALRDGYRPRPSDAFESLSSLFKDFNANTQKNRFGKGISLKTLKSGQKKIEKEIKTHEAALKMLMADKSMDRKSRGFLEAVTRLKDGKQELLDQLKNSKDIILSRDGVEKGKTFVRIGDSRSWKGLSGRGMTPLQRERKLISMIESGKSPSPAFNQASMGIFAPIGSGSISPRHEFGHAFFRVAEPDDRKDVLRKLYDIAGKNPWLKKRLLEGNRETALSLTDESVAQVMAGRQQSRSADRFRRLSILEKQPQIAKKFTGWGDMDKEMDASISHHLIGDYGVNQAGYGVAPKKTFLP